MDKTQKTDLAVERLLKLIYPEGSELAKVSFNEWHALNTTCDLIEDLTAKLTASEKRVEELELRGNVKCCKCGAVYPDPHLGDC